MPPRQLETKPAVALKHTIKTMECLLSSSSLFWHQPTYSRRCRGYRHGGRSVDPAVFLRDAQQKQAQLPPPRQSEAKRRHLEPTLVEVQQMAEEPSFASAAVKPTFSFAAAVAQGGSKEWSPSHVVWSLLLLSLTSIQLPLNRLLPPLALKLPSSWATLGFGVLKC